MTRTLDPGSRSVALFCWVAAILLMGTVIYVQQAGSSLTQPPKAPTAAGSVIDAPDASLTMMAKLFVKMNGFFAGQGQGQGPSPIAQAGSVGPQMEELAHNDADRVRAAIVSIDIDGPGSVDKHLDDLDRKLAVDSPLRTDVVMLRELYRGSPPTGSAAEAFKKRHEWYAELALTFGKPDSDPARAKIVSGGGLLIAFIMIFGLVMAIAVITGFVLLIVGAVMFLNGTLRWKMDRPAPGGSLGIEMFVVFLAGFLMLKVAGWAIASVASPDVVLVSVLALQWLLMGVLAYPMLRGVPRAEAWGRLGLHTGSGVLKEIGCGIVGYLASLPLLLVGVAFAIVLMLMQAMYYAVTGQSAPPPPNNQLVELVGGTKTFELAMIVVLATVWAPIVEETVFRGALYRQLRSMWWVFPSALVTAMIFAFMHNYPVIVLPVLVGLATGFALIRQWRGSLIACMTAHFIHNAFAMILLLTMTRLLDL